MTADKAPETLAAQALGLEDPVSGALVPPVHMSTTFARRDDYSLPDDRSYIRDHGATQEQVEQVIRDLEGGYDAISFSSGLAACTAPFHALEAGDHVLVSDTIYHGVLSWLAEFAEARGIGYDLFPAGDLERFAGMIRPGVTRLVWLETPANPVWTVTDIAAVSTITHARGIRVAVDSTCATPVLTRPIEFGADFVCHSATKYLNGHSDVLAGLLVAAADSAYWQRIRRHRLLAGSMLGSMEAWLLLRGLRTLYLRVRQQSANALALAGWLAEHPCVEQVFYPGLPRDPGHETACRQMSGGFGGMLSILVPGGRSEAVAVACRASVFKRATSLGGVESVLEHRKSSEGDVTSTPENLIRISAGIEHIDDLIGDFSRMLAKEPAP